MYTCALIRPFPPLLRVLTVVTFLSCCERIRVMASGLTRKLSRARPKTSHGSLERGHVIEYLQATMQWKVKFEHEEIQVDLDGLNEMVHMRFSDEFPGRRARAAPYQSAVEYDKNLKKLLDGCDLEAWKKPLKYRKSCNYDTRHWMQKFGDMLAAQPGTPAHNLFFQLLSDALFTILPGEHSRVKFFLRTQRNLSDKDVAGMKRNYWRRNCRYSCEPPDVLLPRIYFMYKFFCTLDQADNEETKVLKDNHERIFMKEIKHVQQGLLSDPPGACELLYAQTCVSNVLTNTVVQCRNDDVCGLEADSTKTSPRTSPSHSVPVPSHVVWIGGKLPALQGLHAPRREGLVIGEFACSQQPLGLGMEHPCPATVWRDSRGRSFMALVGRSSG